MRFFFIPETMRGESLDVMLKAFTNKPCLMVAYTRGNPEKMMDLVNRNVDVLVDSGAYELWTRGKPVSLEKYCEYLDIVRGNVFGYFNLDVIGDPEASKQNYILMRKKGYYPIPIFHYKSDYSYLNFYLSQTDYIGLGGLVGKFRQAKGWIKETMKRIPKHVKVHLLGSFNEDILMSSKFATCDSSGCIRSASMGNVITPAGSMQRVGIRRSTPSEKYFIHMLNVKQMLIRERRITDYWDGRV